MMEIKGLEKNLAAEAVSACDVGWEKLLARADVGFFRLPERLELWKICQARLSVLDARVDRVVVVGIGGSSLGAKVIWDAVGRFVSKRPFHFLESVDPVTFDDTCAQIHDWSRTHFVLVSKSGGTLETIALMEHLNLRLTEKKLQLSALATVIAGDEPGPIQQWARDRDVPTLPFPTDVGGRFSVLSPAGLFPACLMGVSLEELRQGGLWALEQRRLVTSLSAAFLQSFDRQEWITQMWIYSERLKSLGPWWQQLWSESLAKKIDRQGRSAPRVSTPITCVGPQDQHSLLQQLIEGARDKFIVIVRSLHVEAQGQRLAQATVDSFTRPLSGLTLGQILAAEGEALESSLHEAGVACVSIRLGEPSARTLGGLFMLWELIIGTMGETLDLDAFNQPGVELGKKHAIQNLRRLL